MERIRNFSCASLIDQYHLPVPCDVSDYDLKVRGITSQGPKTYSVKIHACSDIPFRGPHLVSIADGPPFWVQSLTAFKKNFFNFKDHLSFERSFYVMIPRLPHGVRLQNIRFIATLPRIKLPQNHDVHVSPFHVKPAKRSYFPKLIKDPNTIRKVFLHKTVQRLVAMYIKLYPDAQRGPMFRTQCLNMLCHDFEEACSDIREILIPEDLDDIMQEILEECEEDV